MAGRESCEYPSQYVNTAVPECHLLFVLVCDHKVADFPVFQYFGVILSGRSLLIDGMGLRRQGLHVIFEIQLDHGLIVQFPRTVLFPGTFASELVLCLEYLL